MRDQRLAGAYEVGEEEARKAVAGDDHFGLFAKAVNTMALQFAVHESFEGTVDGAYQVRIEIVPVPRGQGA